MPLDRRDFLALLGASLARPSLALPADKSEPLKIAVNAEFGMPGGFAAQSIEKGVALAIAEINARGGVLKGKKLALVRYDDRGVPARAIDNLRQLAQDPTVLAVFCGRFSPVALELAPVTHQLGLPMLNPWAAADAITRGQPKPNYVFRLSLTDSLAIEALLAYAKRRRMRRLLVLLPNTAWGRSSQGVMEQYVKGKSGPDLDMVWYNWGDTDFTEALLVASRNAVDGILMVANEAEGKFILEQLANRPSMMRMPILSHWGITAGDFNRASGGLASKLDLVTVQTFAFSDPLSEKQKAVLTSAREYLGENLRSMPALVGFAHAYDLTHLFSMAMNGAGVPDRRAIRDAMEALPRYEGLVRTYVRPFSSVNHEALGKEQVFIARFNQDGVLYRAGGV